MKFHDFLESNHVETNIKLQIDYHPRLQARIQAGSNLIKAQRAILTLFQYPQLLGSYLLVLLHIKDAPHTAQQLVQEYKDQAIAKAKEVQPTPYNPVTDSKTPTALANIVSVPNGPSVSLAPSALTTAAEQYSPATETREQAIQRQLARQKAEAEKSNK